MPSTKDFEQSLCVGGVDSETIQIAEELLNLSFPSAYRKFLEECGSITTGNLEIMGLGVLYDSTASVIKGVNVLRLACPNAPVGLLPIRIVEQNLLHCLQCEINNSDVGSVFLFDLATSRVLSKVSTNFEDYLRICIHGKRYKEIAINRLEIHVKNFEEDYLSIGKVPRNHIWRPYRFCVQDIVLGLVVVRHSLELNCLEVDICLTSDVPEYESGSGAKMTSAFLFSEAYKCGGTMELRFTDNVEDRRVPEALCKLADTLGVSLHHIDEGRITPTEARHFYMAITDFSPMLHDRIVHTALQGFLSQESVCYAVHRGIWSHAEVETLIFGSQRPNSIFIGQTPPELRHLYMHDVVHARSAIMGGLLDKKLAKRERQEGGVALELEDDVRRLSIMFDISVYGKQYVCDDPVPIPWLAGQDDNELVLDPNNTLNVLLRARDTSELSSHLANDIELAQQQHALAGAPTNLVFVLVPRDFEQLPLEQQTVLKQKARASNVGILVCP